jgi:hypothetical protein
LAAVVVGA